MKCAPLSGHILSVFWDVNIYTVSFITSFYRTFGCPIICTDSIHSAIIVIDTSNNALYSQVHWLVRTPYLAVKASNVSSTEIPPNLYKTDTETETAR